MPFKRESLREVMEEILRRSTMSQGASENAGSGLVTKYTVAEQRRQRLRVLLVEDDPVDQLVASAAMRRMGYEPTVVKSGGEALEAVRLQPFDVIFLDIVMPDLDGWEVASIIRREEPEGVRTPIIATTALHSERGGRARRSRHRRRPQPAGRRDGYDQSDGATGRGARAPPRTPRRSREAKQRWAADGGSRRGRGGRSGLVAPCPSPMRFRSSICRG